MSDLISRQSAIDVLRTCYDTETRDDTNGDIWIRYEDACEGVEALPSAQPEIIRCKDCTRFEKKRGCNLVEGLNIAKADSFCSYAERRTDG